MSSPSGDVAGSAPVTSSAGPSSPAPLAAAAASSSSSSSNALTQSNSTTAVAAAAGASAATEQESIPEQTKFEPSLLAPLQLSVGEDLLLPFVEEYSKLQQALAKSHESEGRFIGKCKSLIKQTRAHTHKLTALTAIHTQDLKKKKQLGEEIEKHRQQYAKITEEMKEKKDLVKDLRQELQTLGAQLEESSNDFLRQQRNTIARLELEVNKYTMIRDKDRAALTKLRAKNVDLFKSLQDMLAALSRSQQEYDSLEAKLLEAKALSGKELRRKAELEKNMKDIQARVAERQTQLNMKKELIAKSRKELSDLESQLSKSEQIVEKHREEYEQLNESARQSNENLLEIQESNEILNIQLKKSQKELEVEKSNVKVAKSNAEKQLKLLELMRDKVKELSEETRINEESKNESANTMKLLKEQISAMQYKLNTNTKAMDTCVREREVLSQNHMAKLDAIKQKEALLKIKTSTLKNIKNEHQGYLISIRALTKIVEDLKHDKANHESDLNRRVQQKTRALEEVAQRELQITEYQTQITLNESKLRQQQNLLEAVRSDRNMYRKTLIEQQNEMHEYKRKFHYLSTQVKQLKGEINDKDQHIVFEHLNLQNVKDDIFSLEQQNTSTFKSLEKVDVNIKIQMKQIRKLSTIIADADEELRVQVKQYNAIVNEQRVLNQQLVKRNDELANLYEQLKLQNSVLIKSAAHYKEKQFYLQEMEYERTILHKTLEEVLQDIHKFTELKDTIAQVQEQLVQEQLKVKALSDELKKPINIHRWRRLMDTNTDTYSMIKKVRSLQKQIIDKTALVEQKDEKIQEKEKLYVELRKVLAKQPGSEAAEQLKVYMEQLDEKKSKLKTMKSELKLYQVKVKEFQYDLDKLNGDIQLLKIAYFQKKRKHSKLSGKQAWRADSQSINTSVEDDMPDILKPTEFPSFAPPPHAHTDSNSSNSSFPPNNNNNAFHPTSYPADFNSQFIPNASFPSQLNSHIPNTYSSQFQSNPSSNAFSSSVKGLDESDDDDESDGELDNDNKNSVEEKEEKQSSYPRPLSASRPYSSHSRPDSRSTAIPPLADQLHTQRSNSSIVSDRDSERGTSDAKYSRFPAIH